MKFWPGDLFYSEIETVPPFSVLHTLLIVIVAHTAKWPIKAVCMQSESDISCSGAVNVAGVPKPVDASPLREI